MTIINHILPIRPDYLAPLVSVFQNQPVITGVFSHKCWVTPDSPGPASNEWTFLLKDQTNRHLLHKVLNTFEYYPMLADEIEQLVFGLDELRGPFDASINLLHLLGRAYPVVYEVVDFSPVQLSIYGTERLRIWSDAFYNNRMKQDKTITGNPQMADYLFKTTYLIYEAKDGKQLVVHQEYRQTFFKFTSGFDPTADAYNQMDFSELDMNYDPDYGEPHPPKPITKLHYRIDADGVHDFTYPEYRQFRKW